MKRALPLLLTLLVVLPWAEAREPVTYGPVPAELAAVVGDAGDDVLARTAIAAIERGTSDTETARALLILLGDTGLKATAERLAQGSLPGPTRVDLLTVVAASEHPDADTLLERAAGEGRPALRMLAADGLGRDRTPRAVSVLARLARDPVPGVRIAALRSLFALSSPQAAAARIAVPRDSEYELLAKRLRWHHRCEDADPALRTMAVDAYLRTRSVSVRMAAAHYLTLPALDAPREVLDLILREMGGGPLLAGAVRVGRGLPHEGYDAAHERRIAIDAAFTLLGRQDVDAAARKRVVDSAVGWVARPVAMDPYRRDPIPEHVLRRRLPDLGEVILEPVVRRLERGGFEDPRPGVILLRELGADIALPALRAFLEPRASRPPFESRAEAAQRRYLRNAAAGAVQDLGRIGDERLARALLTGAEDKALKIEILHALREEEGAWVVPLLAEVMRGTEPELRSHAITILEGRPEPEARSLLVEDLFERVERPHDRLRVLVRRGDEPAYTVLKRALTDDRRLLRIAALSQFLRRRNPRLMGPEAKGLLEAYVPDPKNRLEIQQYVYALLSVAPERAVAWVREAWTRLPTDGLRMTVLRILGEANGKKARAAAIDLALEKVAGDVPKPMKLTAAAVFMGPREDTTEYGYDWTYRVEDVGAFWRSLLDAEDAQLQREAIQAYTHTQAPTAHVRLLALLERALAGKALPEDASTPASEQSYARDVITALTHQAWEHVETPLVDVALDPFSELTTRVLTAHLLMGRLSDDARKRLLAWLDYTPPPTEPVPDAGAPAPKQAPGRLADGVLQLFLAAAVGEGADASIAGLLYETLKRELLAFYTPKQLGALLQGGPGVAAAEEELWGRVVPLARGISRTKHVPSILALLDLVFDMRFALYARACASAQGAFARAAGAGAAAFTPSRLNDLSHDDQTPFWGMPTALYHILLQIKELDDDVLASGYRRVLEQARRDGRLAHFPALFMHRVQTNLLDPHTGRKPRTAEIVLSFAERMGRPDGPIHLRLHARAVQELADAGAFAAAARAQADVVRIVARGSHDDREPGLMVLNRAVLYALQGAAAAQAGESMLAAAHFMNALLCAPDDPNILNTVAWYRAVSGFGLDEAEAEARRATLLEARVDNRPSANSTDTLAYVLFKRGRSQEGLALLGPRMRERGAHDNGPLHYHMAQMYAAVRAWRSARDALVRALTWDRLLARDAQTEPLFEPLFEKQSLEDIRALAAEERVRQDLP